MILLETVFPANNSVRTSSRIRRNSMVNQFRKYLLQSEHASCTSQPMHRSVIARRKGRKNRVALRLMRRE